MILLMHLNDYLSLRFGQYYSQLTILIMHFNYHLSMPFCEPSINDITMALTITPPANFSNH
jgi:hypothetical protein